MYGNVFVVCLHWSVLLISSRGYLSEKDVRFGKVMDCSTKIEQRWIVMFLWFVFSRCCVGGTQNEWWWCFSCNVSYQRTPQKKAFRARAKSATRKELGVTGGGESFTILIQFFSTSLYIPRCWYVLHSKCSSAYVIMNCSILWRQEMSKWESRTTQGRFSSLLEELWWSQL